MSEIYAKMGGLTDCEAIVGYCGGKNLCTFWKHIWLYGDFNCIIRAWYFVDCCFVDEAIILNVSALYQNILERFYEIIVVGELVIFYIEAVLNLNNAG